jgi:archaemetzincin
MGLISYIYLWWIGRREAEKGMMDEIKAHMENVFEVPVRITEQAQRPADTFDIVRRQYSSTKILRWILQGVPEDASKVVAITDGDLFIPVLTFVFGEAQLGGKGAVVSTARLRKDFNDLPSPPKLFRTRLLKECVHELGHTFGLTHCALSRCAMSRSNTVLDVDAKDPYLCQDCGRLLKLHKSKQG